ncbi:Rha family transcriptional regulator [Lacrimispora sp. JR3]|uniref:Rha family transcriptional regulator n=1 Tax=Lacrimispora sinapis TaxID=3111456 RepID=UPI003747D375
MKSLNQTLDSREVAEMVGKQHKNVVRDIRVYIEELNELKIEPVDFFKESTYTDGKGEVRPCFLVTKKGCEFIAHKLTGIKGTEFTARYINRFHDMEDTIREGIPQRGSTPKRPALSSVNMAAKIMKDSYKEAGVDSKFIAVAVNNLYKNEAGIDFGIPLITDMVDMPKLYDCTEIAKELGIYSTGDKPHSLAVSAIIQKLHMEESEIVTTPFSRNGHSDVTVQYKPSVFDDVKLWLAENNYPVGISYVDSKGNAKLCTVVYRGVA